MSDRLIPRTFAVGFAAMITLAMLSGIDALATTEHAAREQRASSPAAPQLTATSGCARNG